MLLMPDPTTAQMDPFSAVPTIVLNCNVKDPVTMEAYTRDPRYVAQKAELFLKQTGIADTVYIGPELEFFIFDSIKFDQGYNFGFYQIDSEAGAWNTGKEGLGYRPRYKQGYFPVPPMDHFQDLRSEMVLNLEKVGVRVEVHHHEVATAGQSEIDMRFDTLTKMADRVMWYKYVTKNTARKHGKTVTFMPKPLFQDNGSGMHTHQSLWKNGKNLFYEVGGYADISKMCLHYIGGILKHAPALLAFIAPSTNSYRRLVPGYEAPDQPRLQPAEPVRVHPDPRVLAVGEGQAHRVPDARSVLQPVPVVRGLRDGRPRRHREQDRSRASPSTRTSTSCRRRSRRPIKQLPGSLDVVLDNLEKDHDFLLKGDVFTPDLIETWLEYKRKNEVDAIRLRPHPHEFALYYDI